MTRGGWWGEVTEGITMQELHGSPHAPRDVAGRNDNIVRQLKIFYEDGLLTGEFYCERVAECANPQ